jgi:hypothetical protein
MTDCFDLEFINAPLRANNYLRLSSVLWLRVVYETLGDSDGGARAVKKGAGYEITVGRASLPIWCIGRSMLDFSLRLDSLANAEDAIP